MSKIKISNFGPIKIGCTDTDGWIHINKVNIFIGNQGSGKSTIAKLISIFTWIEKSLVRGDRNRRILEKKNVFKNHFLSYHRLENFLHLKEGKSTSIDYRGEAYHISYANGFLSVYDIKDENTYTLPQIMYVPAERNFLSYVKSSDDIKLSSDSLKDFLTEFNNAKNNISNSLKLPVNDTLLEYDKLNINYA